MMHLVYDGSFEGLLTAVFEVYERKLEVITIVRKELYQPILQGEPLNIISDHQKAERVWNGIKRKVSAIKRTELYTAFLSELSTIEDTLMVYIRHIFDSDHNVEKDYGHKAVLTVQQTARKVYHEKHRMEAFVRFQRTADDLYYASIEPDYNVIPLIASHFKERYADQHWIIYDKKRDYGIHYNKDAFTLQEIFMELMQEAEHEFLPASMCHEEEVAYQALWKEYFHHVNIKSRNNRKLHIRHVPTRYWKYLVEKQ
ncbi:TIGR03915 family putative DNA repair protein [Ohtaekwangia koreensis]|uniref:Probable DNA metabolism protein n=1 Tax=Ohtaekwangia koreensis TaxID=688867 RepID=A0A1T5M2H1_9BACT|nr:TIGR03915 family putative DNA repair protein [Ohtaekwangia koreensis]SKC82049.1 probable DNA metabolism protein [Ohtaekwangia koreensis]